MNIVFRWVGRNVKFNEIEIQNDLTVEKIKKGNFYSFFSYDNRNDNCDFIGEDLQSEFKVQDKNIYCNDILEIINEEIKDIRYYKVIFENGSFVCYHKYGRWGLLSRFFEPDLKHFKLKIAGTIYQNPELLSA